MPTTDTSERGLETLILSALTGLSADDLADGEVSRETHPPYGRADYALGARHDFDRDHAVDLAQLRTFVSCTQPEAAGALELGEEGPRRTQFLHRLQGEIARRGVIDVLRHGVKHQAVSLDLFAGLWPLQSLWAARLSA